MDTASLFRRTAAGVNAVVLPLLRRTPLGRTLGGSMAVVSYRGRRSGRQVTFPVNYRREGADVVIGVMAPDAKTWWRNFTGDGAPIHLTLGREELDGHGTVQRGSGGSVAVRVTPA